jgi:hypothetical protein
MMANFLVAAAANFSTTTTTAAATATTAATSPVFFTQPSILAVSLRAFDHVVLPVPWRNVHCSGGLRRFHRRRSGRRRGHRLVIQRTIQRISTRLALRRAKTTARSAEAVGQIGGGGLGDDVPARGWTTRGRAFR